MSGKYDDIIHMPHHVSPLRSHMPLADRAAQFAPFAALTGYEASIREAARLTDAKLALDEYEKEALDEKLRLLSEKAQSCGPVTLTYFLADAKKAGGAYVTACAQVRKVDAYARVVVLADGRRIPIDDIADIECGIFPQL